MRLRYLRHNLGIAVKCGGNHGSAASSIEDGVVIDMRELNAVVINNATNSITIGGGCRWADVYSALKTTSRICVGGGVHIVGVGGHLTGGESNFLSARYGLV